MACRDGGFTNMLAITFMHYPLPCLHFGMPSLHPFTLLMLFKSCFCTFLMLISVIVGPKPKKNISSVLNSNPRTALTN